MVIKRNHCYLFTKKRSNSFLLSGSGRVPQRRFCLLAAAFRVYCVRVNYVTMFVCTGSVNICVWQWKCVFDPIRLLDSMPCLCGSKHTLEHVVVKGLWRAKDTLTHSHPQTSTRECGQFVAICVFGVFHRLGWDVSLWQRAASLIPLKWKCCVV